MFSTGYDGSSPFYYLGPSVHRSNMSYEVIPTDTCCAAEYAICMFCGLISVCSCPVTVLKTERDAAYKKGRVVVLIGCQVSFHTLWLSTCLPLSSVTVCCSTCSSARGHAGGRGGGGQTGCRGGTR